MNYGRPRFHFDENASGAGGDAGAAAAAAAAAAKPWHDGVPDEIKGFWQNKGLPLDSPKEFSTKLTDLYRSAEKFIGVPPDQVVKIPKADAAPEDIRAYYERLGAPKEAKDYDVSAVKDPTIAEALRATMHERGVPKEAAAAIAASVAKSLESKATSDSTVNAQKLSDQKAALRANWGDKFEFNHLQAMEGARRLGISPEAVQAMEGQIGYDKVMESMRKIGANTREDTFVERGGGGPTGDVTTREGAVSRKAELMADRAWSDRYLKGGAAEAREMTRLNTLIDGGM